MEDPLLPNMVIRRCADKGRHWSVADRPLPLGFHPGADSHQTAGVGHRDDGPE